MFTLDALRDAVAPRLAAAHVEAEPFPHVWVDDVWPADFYARLEAAWPGDHLFYADKKGRKWNLAATAVPPSQKRGDFAAVPADHQALWCFVVEQVNAQIVGPWLADVFREHLEERTAAFRDWERDGRALPNGIQVDGLHVTRGRFMMRGNGYVLKPHCDGAACVVTALYYFGGGDENEHGTILYQADRPLPLDAFLRSGKTEYFHTHDVPVREARRVVFRPNRLVAFANRLDAAHGVLAPTDATRRKVLQFHLAFRDGPGAEPEY